MTKTNHSSTFSTASPELTEKKDLYTDHSICYPENFTQIDRIIESLHEEQFLSLSLRKRFKIINQTLCKLIQETPNPTFLLRAVLDYFYRVNQAEVLNEPINMASFEFWLNIFSELSEKENYEIRAKIVGKHIPRADYQPFFPVGMGRTFAGTHFVAAHLSPDVDTMIASFWGWIDAFASRIGTSLHLWSLPGGPPDSPVTSILKELFGLTTFTYLARTAPTLTLTAMDLVTQKNLTKEKGDILTGKIDSRLHERAIILINDQGHYLGDWRISDVEVVRQIIISFKSCLRWFENNLHTKLISLFAKQDLSTQDLPAFNSSVFDVKIKDCEPALDFNEQQKSELHDFFIKVIGLEKGLEGTFSDLNQALKQLSVLEMAHFQNEIEKLASSNLFESSGRLLEDRPKIFRFLDQMIKDLDESIHKVRNYVERLDVVLAIKYRVLNISPDYITLRSDVDEMRQKMQHYDYLTVIIPEQDGSLFPVGIVRKTDLNKSSLGTVSLRDFCNLDEVKMASYLEVISVIDHHKSFLKTSSIPSAIIGDAQSCNVLVAEQAFVINDRYSLGGMTLSEIENQIKEINEAPSLSLNQVYLLQRLLQRQMAARQANTAYYVHPQREFNEYLCFLHAILDDTDLLTKVSNRDLDCVVQLLNRLKSLSVRRESEVVSLDDIPRDHLFAKTAAKRILQHPDMYALYKKTYDYKEKDIRNNLELCIQGHPCFIFSDTKEQNGCARVGQTKLFTSNFPYFQEHRQAIYEIWLNQAKAVHQDYPEIDLHIHMMSTVASAEEVYHNQTEPYKHQDELWFWIPQTLQAHDHLNSFLGNFQSILQGLKDHHMFVEFSGPYLEEYSHLFQRNLPFITQKIDKTNQGLPRVILHFRAGTLNSRKSMVSPFIPRLVS